MNSRKFKAIGILIGLVLILAISLHTYYFINNYKEAYNQFTADVSYSFDQSIKDYLDELSKVDVVVITDLKASDDFKSNTDSSILANTIAKNFFQRFTESPFSDKGSEILEKKVKELDGMNITQIVIQGGSENEEAFIDNDNKIIMMAGKRAADSISSISSISNKLIISVSRDTIDFELMNEYFRERLQEKQIEIQYGIQHFTKDSLTGSFQNKLISQLPLEYTSAAQDLPRNERLQLFYENASFYIFRNGLINSAYSLSFFLLIIIVLTFLYRTIKDQKDLAEIKNDLINNITHEFKTPLATISTAVEALQNFNPENDPEKTKRYLQIGQQQLSKMNGMVEKLLETATLDSEKLMIKRETIDLTTFCKDFYERYRDHGTNKDFTIEIPNEGQQVEADIFHLENAVSNLLDNAFKYGGENIILKCRSLNGKTLISVTDNGGNLTKAQTKRIFDKFYRVPQGNIHNVKGFGIGLYYSKKVIEKHNGNLEVEINKKSTRFEITLP